MTKQKKPRMDIRGYVFVSSLVIEVFKVFEKLHRDTGFQPVLLMSHWLKSQTRMPNQFRNPNPRINDQSPNDEIRNRKSLFMPGLSAIT
jgi:hypothetical protein